MNYPTPFAQLGLTTKTASEMFSTGNTAADIGVEMLAGSNPFTGVPYYGARAVDDFTKGKIMSGVGNLAFGALSFLPGASLAKGVIKGVATGAAKNPGLWAKGVNAVSKGFNAVKTPVVNTINTAAKGTGVAGTAARGAQQYGQAIQKGQQAVNKAVNPMLDAAGRGISKVAPKVSPQAGRRIAGNGALLGSYGVVGSVTNPATAAAAAPVAAAPMNAPSWYTAVTGHTAMPKY